MGLADLPELATRRSNSRPRLRTPFIGLFSFLLSLGAAVACGYAIAEASSGAFASGTQLGFFSIGAGVVAFGLGLAAVITGRGRAWGVAAMVVSLVSDPLILLYLLGALEHV